ncbi:GntR family transcriptional regulator [Amnibacterium soli]|uniref:GntR family transcriptional regulator n=1 Tax=Amnibacterium soli TaxID=1282736 RepID=A0ABP8YZS5_9MICO
MPLPELRVDPAAAAPPFEQLRAQLADAIRGGGIAPGERLPTVRGLAESLGLAANTVARAVKELEAEGLVETRGRNGTVVSWSPDSGTRELEQAAAAFAARARALGVAPEDARLLVDRALGLAP